MTSLSSIENNENLGLSSHQKYLSVRNLSTDILGKTYSFPLGLAPVGMGGMMYPNGEILVAKAASVMNIPYILSTMSICSLEQVAEHSKNSFWFQQINFLSFKRRDSSLTRNTCFFTYHIHFNSHIMMTLSIHDEK